MADVNQPFTTDFRYRSDIIPEKTKISSLCCSRLFASITDESGISCLPKSVIPPNTMNLLSPLSPICRINSLTTECRHKDVQLRFGESLYWFSDDMPRTPIS